MRRRRRRVRIVVIVSSGSSSSTDMHNDILDRITAGSRFGLNSRNTRINIARIFNLVAELVSTHQF